MKNKIFDRQVSFNSAFAVAPKTKKGNDTTKKIVTMEKAVLRSNGSLHPISAENLCSFF